MSNVTEAIHRIGKCPACRAGIHARVDLVVVVGKPSISPETGNAVVGAYVNKVGAVVDHTCGTRDRREEPTDG